MFLSAQVTKVPKQPPAFPKPRQVEQNICIYMKQQRVHLLVTGKVQGVFFRQALKVVAKKNNVLGWVRNLKDGRVEAILEGDNKSINSVIEWTRIGPANSRVDDIEVSNEEFKNEFLTFDVLY